MSIDSCMEPLLSSDSVFSSPHSSTFSSPHSSTSAYSIETFPGSDQTPAPLLNPSKNSANEREHINTEGITHDDITTEITQTADEKEHAFLQQLVNEFAPIPMIHPKEAYRPCSVEYYLSNVSLYHGHMKVLDRGLVTSSIIGNPDELERLRCSAEEKMFKEREKMREQGIAPPLFNDRPSEGFNMRLAKDARGGQALEEAPIYARVRTTEKDWEILYMFHYAYNAPYHLFGVFPVGAHDADWEHLCLRVSRRTRRVKHVYFGAHGYRDGIWRHAQHRRLEWEGKHVIAYIAKGEHGVYPHPGFYPRILCCANDVTASRSNRVRWKPSRIELVYPPGHTLYSPSMHWLGYRGSWCHDGIRTPHDQGWWHNEPQTSNTALRRVFFSFLPRCFSLQPELWCLRRHTEWEKDDYEDDCEQGETNMQMNTKR